MEHPGRLTGQRCHAGLRRPTCATRRQPSRLNRSQSCHRRLPLQDATDVPHFTPTGRAPGFPCRSELARLPSRPDQRSRSPVSGGETRAPVRPKPLGLAEQPLGDAAAQDRVSVEGSIDHLHAEAGGLSAAFECFVRAAPLPSRGIVSGREHPPLFRSDPMRKSLFRRGPRGLGKLLGDRSRGRLLLELCKTAWMRRSAGWTSKVVPDPEPRG